MIDLKLLRDDPERIRAALKKRNSDIDLDRIIEMEKQRRAGMTEVQELKSKRNALSEEIAKLKRQGEEPEKLMEQARLLSEQIKKKEEKQRETEQNFGDAVQWLPNVPHESVPVGAGPEANRFIRGLTKAPEADFEVLPHWDICEALDILDLKRASKISGSRFILYKGMGALLERALINFFLDLHTTKHGYTEIFPPVLNPTECLYGTGQLPKLESDMYRCRDDAFYLTPTAEVPLTNMHREEILLEKQLPVRYVAYTPCFRREAGSYGKEVRGITRVHQFNKVELVKYATPENGYTEFEKMLKDAEAAVKALRLPYRIMLLCTGDMTFASAITYDIEVYAPGMKEWLEVSSISCYEQYQSRRANIRYRRPGKGVDFVYTMNGSGLATPRTFIAIVENYQTEDGRIKIPDVLRQYVGVDSIGK
ncbi:MAG: serine--tRNA ligase [candidate division WOR-3 bacterium]|nr:MAG: serine--tRNA ligase [candidate division WOR-3 bacterium]